MNKFLATSAAIALSIGAAQAASVTFDLQGSGGSYSSLPSSVSLTDAATGLTMTADAKAFRQLHRSGSTILASSDIVDAKLGQYAGGAGVYNSAADSSHTVDGYGWKDFIELSFDQDVSISSLTFGYFDHYDGFSVLTDVNGDGQIGAGDTIGARMDIPNSGSVFGSVDLLAGDVLGVGAFWKIDSWKLKSVTVNFEDNTNVQPPAVPLPAGGVLLLTGLAGLAVARGRKKA